MEISARDISVIYTSLNHRLEMKKGLYPNDTQTIALLEDCHNRYIVQDAECEVIGRSVSPESCNSQLALTNSML